MSRIIESNLDIVGLTGETFSLRVNSDKLFIENNGNTGIGTNNPIGNLHIEDIGIMNTSSGHTMKINTIITDKLSGGDGVTANQFSASYQGTTSSNHYRTINAVAPTYTNSPPNFYRYAISGDGYGNASNDRGVGVYGRSGNGLTRNIGTYGALIGSAGSVENYGIFGYSRMSSGVGDQYAGRFINAVNNASNSGDLFGIRVTVSNSGAAINRNDLIAGYFEALNGATNYSIIVPPNGGSVGIGTVAPTTDFHIVGTTKTQGGRIRNITTGSSTYSAITTDNVISINGNSDIIINSDNFEIGTEFILTKMSGGLVKINLIGGTITVTGGVNGLTTYDWGGAVQFSRGTIIKLNESIWLFDSNH